MTSAEIIKLVDGMDDEGKLELFKHLFDRYRDRMTFGNGEGKRFKCTETFVMKSCFYVIADNEEMADRVIEDMTTGELLFNAQFVESCDCSTIEEV